MFKSNHRGAIAAAAIVVGLSLGSAPVAAFATTAEVQDDVVSTVVVQTQNGSLATSSEQAVATREDGTSTVGDKTTLSAGEDRADSSIDATVTAETEPVSQNPASNSAGKSPSSTAEGAKSSSTDNVAPAQALDGTEESNAAQESGLALTEPQDEESDATSGAKAADIAPEESASSDALTVNSEDAQASQEQEQAGISVRAHVADKGWLDPVGSSETAGTTGENRQMEAVTIDVVNPEGETSRYNSSDIQLRAHVENIGWQNWVSGGEVAGTTGKGLRLEALWLRLRDGSALASDYELWYRAHVQDVGWMAWTNQGPVGSTGQGLRLEALQVALLLKGSSAPGTTSGNAFIDGTNVSVRAHVQDVGWQNWTSKAGQTAGTTGRRLRLEALKAEVSNAFLSGGVEYEAHVQDVGWQGWKDDGAVAGTTGQNRRVEAIRMRLTGELADHYDVWYRVHVQNFGWMAWTSDASSTGTQGLSGRMEALQVLLRQKGSSAPTSTDQGVSFSFVTPSSVVYTAHVQDIGWQSSVQDGQLAGTTGQSKRVEAVTIKLEGSDSSVPGGVRYRAYVADKGWLGWVANGGVAGTTGENRRLEAMQVQLTGELAQYFDVYYQAHSADIGWLGWASNGATSGTSGLSHAIEGFRVQLVFKGNAAPGSTSRPYMDQTMITPAGYHGYQTPGNYYKVGTTRVNVGGSGIFAYSSPVRIGNNATRQDCINAFITRAYDYLGTKYVWDYACAPGVGVDCAGLVMQALYATGMDLGPHYTPYRHYYVPGNDHYANDMANDSRFARVYSAQRGDLVFKTGHVAIYLGNNQIIEAYPGKVRVASLWFTPTVIRRPFV